MAQFGNRMDNVRSYTHPLSGDMHGVRYADGPAAARRSFPVLALALVLGLLLVLVTGGGGCVAWKFWREAGAARAALRDADGRVEYEPLSKVADGSYTEADGGGRARSLGALRKLKGRLR